jgi:Spy/CpxP family protein refolding chaperone
MKVAIFKFASLAVLWTAAAYAFLSPLQQYSTQESPSANAAFGVAGPMDRTTALASMLSLNTAQQANAKAIFDEADATSKPLNEQFEQATDAMLSAQKSGASDSEIDQLARDMGSISGELLAIDAKAQSKVYKLLNANQKQKLEHFPHPFFAASAPLFPPGPMFVHSTDRRE